MRNLYGLATAIISMACSSANSTNSPDAMSPNASGGAIAAESTPSGGFQGLGGTTGSVSTATLGTGGTLPNAMGGSSTMQATGGTQATGGATTIGTSTAMATGGAAAAGGRTSITTTTAGTGGHSTGGSSATAPATGGTRATGGSPSTGGRSTTGGSSSTGGALGTGGSATCLDAAKQACGGLIDNPASYQACLASSGCPGMGTGGTSGTGGSQSAGSGNAVAGDSSAGGTSSYVYTKTGYAIEYCNRATDVATACTCEGTQNGARYHGIANIGKDTANSGQPNVCSCSFGSDGATNIITTLTCQIPTCDVFCEELYAASSQCPNGKFSPQGVCLDVVAPNGNCIPAQATLDACEPYTSCLSIAPATPGVCQPQ